MISQRNSSVTEVGERELFVERVFDAPRELVFKAWTEPERLKQWWGPTGFTTPHCTVDLRPGGVWHYCMRSPEGEDSWGIATYEEIVEPERLVYVDAFSDADRGVFPPKMHITLNFTDEGGRTRLSGPIVFDSAADRAAVLKMGMVEGLTQTQDRLAEYLARQ